MWFSWDIIKWLIAINFDVNIEKRWERARAFEMWTTTASTIMSDNDRTASWLHYYWRTIVLAVSCTYSRQLLMFSFRNFKCLRSLLCARHMYIFFYWFSHSVFDLNTRPENWIALLIHNNQLQLGILCMEQSYALMSYTHAKYAYRYCTRATHTHAHTNAQYSWTRLHCHCNLLHFCALHASSSRDRHNNFMPDLKDSKEHFIIIIKLDMSFILQ